MANKDYHPKVLLDIFFRPFILARYFFKVRIACPIFFWDSTHAPIKNQMVRPLIDELGTAEERRMNQLSTAEFGVTKVRPKFDSSCSRHKLDSSKVRIMKRWSDIDSHAAPLIRRT
jgi:hypothetical protein